MIPTTQLPNETQKAYEAWQAYLGMGEKRSQEAVAAKLKKSRQLLSRWAAKYKWTERLMSANHEDAERQNKAKEQAALEHAKLIEARKVIVMERAWELADALFKKASLIAKWPLEQQTRTENDGKTTIIIEPTKRWQQSDAGRLGEVADELARLAVGLPQRVTAATNADGSAVQTGPAAQPIMNVTFEQTDETKKLEKQFNVLPD